MTYWDSDVHVDGLGGNVLSTDWSLSDQSLTANFFYCSSLGDHFNLLQSSVRCFNCPITGVRLQPTVQLHRLSDFNFTEWLVKNEAANVPIGIEEFVMVIINPFLITYFFIFASNMLHFFKCLACPIKHCQ